MTDREKEETTARNNTMLQEAIASDCDLLLLDELCAACQMEMVDAQLAEEAVRGRPEGREVVISGREPKPWMLETADYITEMRCERHPYDYGISARRGIEY